MPAHPKHEPPKHAHPVLPKPPVSELLERAHVVRLPMRVPFRGVTEREVMLIEGPAGWGEFGPFLEYGPQESAAWLANALEMAYVGPPAPVRSGIPINATVPAVAPEQVAEVLAQFPGCSTVKVKVAQQGQSLADDAARVAAVREANPLAKIRVDANRAWTVSQALEAARALGPLEYMEQPCATVSELAELRTTLQRSGLFVRVAADESIRRAEDPYEVARQHAADVAVIKAAPMGGPRKVLEVAEFFRARGLDITISSALDSGVGMNAGIAAVAALPAHTDDEDFDVPPAAAGLGTQGLFLEDVTAARKLVDGHLQVEMLAPEQARLEALRAPDRVDFWNERLRLAYEVLENL
ncbi:o-succinylbenzoate synthase [Corynebacterium sp. 35RC1]|nr:o-succinylbenzoate synthase [Corynebacterium sp. 35RC1]